MKIFISWAKESAQEIALCLHEWIPTATMNQVTTWCSADFKCLPQGAGYPQTILDAALDADVCLAILTRESINGWWLNFETGLFFGQKKQVYALLCGDLTHQTLSGASHPLSVNGVNYTMPTENGLAGFFESLKQDDPKWQKNNFKKYVANHFSEFESKYDSIFDKRNTTLTEMLVSSAKDTASE